MPDSCESVDLNWYTDLHFPNPELKWHSERSQAESGSQRIDMTAITSRIGPISVEPVLLSGGLANQNIRLGSDRVLRIYLRDKVALSRESELLSRQWKSFRVPNVLDRGDDFLVLEYVEHSPLENGRDQGAAVGRSLAEIHQTKFDSCGTFDRSIQVVKAWPDFPKTIQDYLRTHAERCQEHADLALAAAELVSSHRAEMVALSDAPVLLHGDFKPSNLHKTTGGNLLILDWEFTYAGPALMDIAQLFRWGHPEPFLQAFAKGYEEGGGELTENWKQQLDCFDLVNLFGLLAKSKAGSYQEKDCLRRIREHCG